MIQILTDAGQYVIRFGKSDAASKSGPATMVGFTPEGRILYYFGCTLTVES